MLLKDKQVFIIEDDITNLSVIVTLLKKEGALTKFERWGTRSPEFLKQFLPLDIILLDLMFPRNVSGYDVFNALKAIPEFQHIPVVAVTAADPDTEMHKARELGFAGFISKPLDFHNFGTQVAGVLNGQSVWQHEYARSR